MSFHLILRNVSLSPYQTTMRLVQIIGKDVVHLVDRMAGIPLMLVGFPGVAKDFFSELTLSFRLSSGVPTSPCAICARVKDLGFHVRIRWIMETLKYSACTRKLGSHYWRSWLSLRKEADFPKGEIPDNSLVKKKKEKKQHMLADVCPVCDVMA